MNTTSRHGRVGGVPATRRTMAGADRPTTSSAAMMAALNRRTTEGTLHVGTECYSGMVTCTIPSADHLSVIPSPAVPPRTDSAYHRDMPNRLAGETSPYLLQHANNPVDWYPWGPDALAARKAPRPADLPVASATRPVTGVT